MKMMRVMMAMVMMMSVMNMMAQGHRRAGEMGRSRAGREMVVNDRGRIGMHGTGHRAAEPRIVHRDAHRPAPVHVVHHYDRGPWAGRVRHMPDGRWGYYRAGCWYYYDCYYEPDFYFAHPIHHFHSHCLGTVAAAAVTTAAVATLINALAH